MSYSITVTAPDLPTARLRLREEFDKVIAAQPIHHRDHTQALHAACGFIQVLPDDDTHDVQVTVSGYIAATEQTVTGVSCSVNAVLIKRPDPEPTAESVAETPAAAEAP